MIAGIGADPPAPRRLVLWRHGRTDWNRLGRAQGHADVPLDAVGHAQAAAAADVLATYRPQFVWSSDLARARQTAETLVAVTGNELVLDPRLREYDVGARQGMTFEEFREAYPDLYAGYMAGEDVQVPGAEPAPEVCKRMVAALDGAAAAVSEGETGVLVGHGASLRAGLLAWFDAPPRLREMLAGMSNCSWTVLEHRRRDWGWQIVEYNAQQLPEELPVADEPHA